MLAERDAKNQIQTHDASADYGPNQGHDDAAVTRTDEDEVHVYRKRWFMLLLFCVYSLSNAEQWIHLSIIQNVVERFYNASLPTDPYQRANALDWMSMVFLLSYIPLILPATWALDKKGLRFCIVGGCLLNAVASWIRCASAQQNLFPVLMLSQTLAAITNLWVLGIPPRLAAVWFGPGEVSTATAIGVFGNQIGIAIGFLIPAMLVPNSPSLEEIGTHLRNMFYGSAAVTTAILLLNVFFFQNEPSRPPSLAQRRRLETELHTSYTKSLINLMKNRGFIVLMITYGIITGCFYAVSAELNVIILYYYPGEEESAGRIGLVIVLAGILGSVIAGFWLDKTHTFKSTSVGIYMLTAASMAAFAFTLRLKFLWLAYLISGLLGLTMTGYLPVGFEFAAELTYPEPEGTSSGLLNASAQMFGIAFTMGMRAIINNISVLWANITLVIMLVAGTVLTCFIKADYKRQAAGKEIFAKISNTEQIIPAPSNSINSDVPATARDNFAYVTQDEGTRGLTATGRDNPGSTATGKDNLGLTQD